MRIEIEYEPNQVTNAILYDFAGENVKVYDGENPNLGLDSHGNIWLKNDSQFPILMGGWDYKNDDGELVTITDPLIITFED